jgi:hypothetical protein
MIYNIPTALPNLPPVWQLFPWAVPISLDQTRFFHYAHSRTSITFFSNLTLSNYEVVVIGQGYYTFPLCIIIPGSEQTGIFLG